MTSNRSRKDKIRARQQVTGESYAEAARNVNARCRPIEELLQDASEGMRAVNVGDTLAAVQAAWTALCAMGAAGGLLALCADPDDYPPRWLLAEPILAEAISALRALPLLRGNATEVNPAGGPDDDIDKETADLICRKLTEAADTLAAVLPQAAKHAQTKATRRACRISAATARRVSEVYRAAKTVRPVHPEASGHPKWLPAHTPEELQQLINDHLNDLRTAEPDDVPAALTAAWYGFATAVLLGQFLANRDPDYAVAHQNAHEVIVRIIRVLEAAPSLPAGTYGFGLDTKPTTDPEMMQRARRGIWDLTLEINALLPKVAEQAALEADRQAARIGTRLAAELNDCYEGRLRTFLNPIGRSPGSGSVVIRGKGSGRPRRG